MTVYNKTYFYTGFILYMISIYLDYSRSNHNVFMYIFLISGTITALLALRKPKSQTKDAND
jgi:ABC-type transport system involved in cytochrome c biogenesis permease subunit